MSGRGDSSIYKPNTEFPAYVHKTTPRFWECYQRLPTNIQKLADKQFERLKEEPTHPSLRLEKLEGYDYWSAEELPEIIEQWHLKTRKASSGF